MPFLQKYRPHVFVAMPFGKRDVEPATAGGAPATTDFDLIYEKLFAPALRAAGCDPFRADQEEGGGDIRTDMFFELATADFVLADVTTLNPNVFYELGIRQGVAERGVIMVYDGRTRRPFDIAPDRTFPYRGDLFRTRAPDGREQEVAREVETLAATFKRVIEADPIGKSSPLYKELEGLRPPDIRAIRSARARYFGTVLQGISDRVEVARKRGLAGDILTLAEEAPNAIYRSKLLFAAGRGLIDLKRFDLAQEVLREVVTLAPENVDAGAFLGLSLNRLGQTAEAEVYTLRLIEGATSHADANGALGRIFKDRWRVCWESAATIEERREKASDFCEIARKAISRYGAVFVLDPRTYFNGINVLALTVLLEHLGVDITEMSPSAAEVRPLVEVVARQARRANGRCANDIEASEYVWSSATLGELAVIAGNQKDAVSFYRQASTTPGVSHFALDSMLDQVRMYEKLAFHPAAVAAVVAVLEKAVAATPESRSPLGNVLFCSGHMIDIDGRLSRRFPREKEPVVAAWIDEQLKGWKAGGDDLAITGGARGTDLLFAEACLKREVPVQIFIPLEEGKFLTASVDLPNANWRERYFAVRDHRLTSVRYQPEELGSPPTADPFGRNNRWMLNTAWVQARNRNRLRVLLIWDGRATGDGPGGTSHAAEVAREFAGDLRIVNPLDL